MRAHLILLFVAAPAFAQVNRCDTPAGVVYQQGACAASATAAKQLVKAPEPPPALTPEGPGRDLCIAEAPGYFRDPKSVEVKLITRMHPTRTSFRGKEVVAPTYLMVINAKNGFGGYTGDRRFRCVVSPEEDRVYRIAPSSEG